MTEKKSDSHPAAVSFEGVVKRYASGTQALDGVTFDVEEGEFFGLLGPNGAGKTTLISCLGGLASLTAGRIRVRGVDVARDRRRASLSLGIVPQEITFDPFLTVRETLRFQSGYWGVSNNGAWIDEILENLGLADKADVSMRALSGGMKRRVLVAQALVHKPPVIVLDEPTSFLDIRYKLELLSVLKRMVRENDLTVLLSLHELDLARRISDTVICVAGDRIDRIGAPEEIFTSDYIAQLYHLERGKYDECFSTLEFVP